MKGRAYGEVVEVWEDKVDAEDCECTQDHTANGCSAAGGFVDFAATVPTECWKGLKAPT